MAEINKDAIIKKVFGRLMPVLFVSYILAYIDRINIGFAAIKMNADLGISPYIYGLGAGVFFLGYFIFEVPSNLLLEKTGARRWIARIMISWGLLSAAMVFIEGPTSFIAVRFLLGVAEAGFFPGVILYLTYWFPQQYRARIIAAFMVAIPVSLAIGAPLSTAILQMDGIAGLKGWQWLFLIEGLPTVLFGFVFLAVIPDRPKDAKWLNDEEKIWLQATLDSEHKAVAAAHGTSVLKAFVDPRLIALTFIYFANTTTNFGLSFFLPQMIKSMGATDIQTGFLTSVPYVIGTLGIIIFGYVSDKYQERRWTLFVALMLNGLGLLLAGSLAGSTLSVAAMAIAAIGIFGTKAPFWPLPSMFLTGSAAAGGIALINSIGNLGGFVGPYMVGWIKETTNSYESGLYFLGGLALSAAIVTLIVVNARFAEGRRTAARPSPA
jgi:MFS transporter, ACS family, tartrate transporter